MQAAQFFRGTLEHPFRFLIREHNATAAIDLEDRVGSRFQERRRLDDGLTHLNLWTGPLMFTLPHAHKIRASFLPSRRVLG